MRILFKTLFSLIAILITLMLIAVLTVSWWFDPNDYKQDLINQVKQHTGRDLVIEQPIELTFYPWLGAQVGEVHLSNAPGFAQKPFARIQRLGIRLKLLPLLSRQIEIDTLLLHGLQLHLARDAQGKTNWEDLTQNTDTQPDHATPPSHTQDPLNLSVQQVDVRDASIHWNDQLSGQTYQLNPFNLNIEEFSPGTPAPLQMNLKLHSTQPETTLQLQLSTRLTLSDTLQQITFSDLIANINAQGAMLPADGIFLALNTELALDLQQQNLHLTGLTLNSPTSNGQGELTLQNWSTHPRLQAQLTLDQFNLDDYLPPATSETTTDQVSTAETNPLQILNEIDLQADLQIGQFQASQVRLNDIRLTLQNQQGQLTLQPLQAKLYQGTIAGSAQIDARRTPVHIQTQSTLRDIHIGPLLRDLFGKDRILGQGDLILDINFNGLTEAAIRRSLHGNAGFHLTDGAYQGVNLAEIIQQAGQLFRLDMAETNTASTQRTDFAMLKGSITIQQGQIDNRDLQIQSPLLRINGHGSVDLVQDQVDYLITTKLVKSLTGQGGKAADQLSGIPIPVRITGSLDDLSYKPDFSDLLKSQAQEKKQKVLKKVEDKVRQKATELLGDPSGIGNALRGLLGR